MEARNKFLTEAIGECWHEWTRRQRFSCDGFTCDTCGELGVHGELNNNDFSTWSGFGKLWKLAQEQVWWSSFWSTKVPVANRFDYHVTIELISPDRFANAVYEYLSPNPQGINKDRRRYAGT